jgi:hypothetical protein
MGKWTAERRRNAPEGSFGDPKKRAFPVEDQEDLEHAAELLHHASDPSAVRARLTRIAKRKGLALPKSWQETAAMSDSVRFDLVGFELGTGTIEGDEVLYEDVLIFRCGDYPDKKFSLDENEAEEAIEAFEPVLNELAHVNSQFGEKTILDGKLGEVRDAWISDADDGSVEVRGDVTIPLWLDKIWEGKKQISAVWDRTSKTLEGLGLVVKGRVKDAALMASFALANPEDLDAIFAEGGGYGTPHGRMAVQGIHDMAAQHGAMCSPGSSPAISHIGGPSAGFTSRRERKGLQKIHDAAVEHGASCSMSSGRSMFDDNPKPKEGTVPKNATLATKFRALFGDTLPEETEDDQIDEFIEDLRSTFAKPKDDDDDDEEVEVKNDDDDDEETPPPKPKPGMRGGRRRPKPAAMAAEVVHRPDPEVARQREQIEALQTRLMVADVRAEAVAFADSMINGPVRKALPTERENILSCYIQAAIDDQRSVARVTFSDVEGKAKVGGRVEALKALFARRSAHLAFQEMTSGDIPDGSLVLFNRDDPATRTTAPKSYDDKQLDQALMAGYGDLGRQAVAMRKNGSG